MFQAKSPDICCTSQKINIAYLAKRQFLHVLQWWMWICQDWCILLLLLVCLDVFTALIWNLGWQIGISGLWQCHGDLFSCGSVQGTKAGRLSGKQTVLMGRPDCTMEFCGIFSCLWAKPKISPTPWWVLMMTGGEELVMMSTIAQEWLAESTDRRQILP